MPPHRRWRAPWPSALSRDQSVSGGHIQNSSFPPGSCLDYTTIGRGTRACGSEQRRWTRLAGRAFTARRAVPASGNSVDDSLSFLCATPLDVIVGDGLRFAICGGHGASRPTPRGCRPNWAAGGRGPPPVAFRSGAVVPGPSCCRRR